MELFEALDRNQDKTRIIGYRGDRSACWFYRLHKPLETLQHYNKNYWAITQGAIDDRTFGKMDVAMLQRQYTAPVFDEIIKLKKCGTPLIYEIDDDLFNVPKWSSAHDTFGLSSIRNNIKKFLSNVDGIFVTTRALAEVYKPYNEHIYVLPNSLDFGVFSACPDNYKKPVVCWQGSYTHTNDLKILEPTVQSLVKDDDCSVYMWQADIPGTHKVPFVEFSSFYQCFAQLDVKIGLAPIVPCKFNRSKSNLKFLEYTAQGAAVIASNFGPYADSIEHEETGLLIDNNKEWYDAVRYLLDNEDERLRLVANARKVVEEKFDIHKNYAMWDVAIQDVLQRHKASIPKNRFL